MTAGMLQVLFSPQEVHLLKKDQRSVVCNTAKAKVNGKCYIMIVSHPPDLVGQSSSGGIEALAVDQAAATHAKWDPFEQLRFCGLYCALPEPPVIRRASLFQAVGTAKGSCAHMLPVS